MSQQQIIKLLTLLLVTITTKVNAQLNINAPGVTLKQIIDTVEGTSPELNDTSEGGSLRRFNAAKTRLGFSVLNSKPVHNLNRPVLVTSTLFFHKI